MATAESKKTESSEPNSATPDFMKDGFQTIVQAHNEWLDLAAQQQATLVEAMHDGLKQYATIYRQAEKEYRKAIEIMTDKFNSAVDRTARFGL